MLKRVNFQDVSNPVTGHSMIQIFRLQAQHYTISTEIENYACDMQLKSLVLWSFFCSHDL